MKRQFLLLCSILSILLTGCSSLFEQNKVKADITLNASIPATVLKTLQRKPTARDTLEESEQIEAMIKEIIEGALSELKKMDIRITLEVRGNGYYISKETSYYEVMFNYLKTILTYEKLMDQSYEKELETEVNKTHPVVFNLRGVPMYEPLTFTATLSFNEEDQSGEQTKSSFSAQAIHTITKNEQEIELTIKTPGNEEDENLNSNYDRSALKDEKIKEYQEKASTIYYVNTNQESGEGTEASPYSIEYFFGNKENILANVTDENIRLILTDNITLDPNKIVIAGDDTRNYYLDLNEHSITANVTDSSSENNLYTIDYSSTGSFFVFNGTILQGNANETNSNYAFVKNSITEAGKRGLVTLCGLEFISFNQKIAYQYGSGEISIEYCDFTNCKPNKDTKGLIEVSMYENSADNVYLGGTVSQIGNIFTSCNNISSDNDSNPLFVIKGTMEIIDCQLTDIDYTTLQTEDTCNSTFAYVKSKSNLVIKNSTVKVEGTTNLPAIFLSSGSTLDFETLATTGNEAHCYKSLIYSYPNAILNTKEFEYQSTVEGEFATINNEEQVTIVGDVIEKQ